MATIDLGRLGFVNKGTYNNSTTYEKNDLVQFTDGGILSTYLYIDSSAQSGQAPSSSGTVGSRWTFFAKGVADSVASAGNNKVLVTNASGNLTPLAIGSASQVLKVNSGANGYEFGTEAGGKIGAVAYGVVRSTQALANTSYTDMGLEATITPTKAGSSILVIVSVSSGSQGGTSAGHHYALHRDVNGTGTDTKITEAAGTPSGSRNTGMFAGSSESGSDWTQESSSGNYLDTTSRGLSYSLGQTVKYKVKGFSPNTVAVLNKSYRDGNSNDDTRTMSAITVMEILA